MKLFTINAFSNSWQWGTDAASGRVLEVMENGLGRVCKQAGRLSGLVLPLESGHACRLQVTNIHRALPGLNCCYDSYTPSGIAGLDVGDGYTN